jgi:hypothetical protein
MVIHSGAKWQLMNGLSVLKAELTEDRAKASALENAIKVFGGKSGTVSLRAQRLWFVYVAGGSKRNTNEAEDLWTCHFPVLR